MSDCPENEALVAYVYDECEPAERAHVERHLETCAACAAELDGFAALRGTLRAWAPPDARLGFRVVAEGDTEAARSEVCLPPGGRGEGCVRHGEPPSPRRRSWSRGPRSPASRCATATAASCSAWAGRSRAAARRSRWMARSGRSRSVGGRRDAALAGRAGRSGGGASRGADGAADRRRSGRRAIPAGRGRCGPSGQLTTWLRRGAGA